MSERQVSVILASSSRKAVFYRTDRFLSRFLHRVFVESKYRCYRCLTYRLVTKSASILAILLIINNRIFELLSNIFSSRVILLLFISYDYTIYLKRRAKGRISVILYRIINKIFNEFDFVDFSYSMTPELLLDKLEVCLFNCRYPHLRSLIKYRIFRLLLYPIRVYCNVSVVEYLISHIRNIVSSSLIGLRDLDDFLRKFYEYCSSVLNMRLSKIVIVITLYAAILSAILSITLAVFYHYVCYIFKILGHF